MFLKIQHKLSFPRVFFTVFQQILTFRKLFFLVKFTLLQTIYCGFKHAFALDRFIIALIQFFRKSDPQNIARSKVYTLPLYGSYGVQEAHAVSMRDNTPTRCAER